MTTGENIRNLRKKKGLTQKKLGELSGINEVQIRQYELGKVQPKMVTLKKLATALDTDEWHLLNLTESPLKTPFPISAIVNNAVNKILDDVEPKRMMYFFKLLNKEGQAKAIEQVEMLTKIPEYQAPTASDPTEQESSKKK